MNINDSSNSSPTSTEEKMKARAPCKLLNSSNSDIELPELGEIHYEPISGGVTPIVTKYDEYEQQKSAFIDRRPLISVDSRYTYAEITFTVQPTGCQLKDTAVRQFAKAIESVRQYANTELETQIKDITAILLPGKENDTPAKDYARQRILIRNIVVDAGYVLIEKFVDIIENSNILAQYTYDFNDDSEQPSVPRDGSPTPKPVDLLDGHARHVSLKDKQPPDVSEYVSDNALRAAKRFEDEVSVSISLDQNRASWTESNRGNTAIVEFKDGEPIRYACDCSSGIEPCEHITALLQNLPPISAVYTGSGPHPTLL